MNDFLIALIQVAIMLAYAVPGFIFVKLKAIKQESISAFAKILMYVCQPCLTIYAFDNADYSARILANCGIVFAVSFILMSVVLCVFYFILKKKRDDVRYRVYNVASCFGNGMFMGIPLLQSLFPNNGEVAVYSAVFFLAMSILGWTVASTIITRNKKYVSVKNILLNPAIIALVIALPLFCTQTKLPAQLNDMTTILGKMSTPLCMLIMGMRLGTIKKAKSLLLPPSQYVFIAIKLVAFPLLGFLAVAFLPIDAVVKSTLFVIFCCPIASVVQTFSEMLGEGQETAANAVVLSTIFSIVTIPLMCLMLPLL